MKKKKIENMEVVETQVVSEIEGSYSEVGTSDDTMLESIYEAYLYRSYSCLIFIINSDIKCFTGAISLCWEFVTSMLILQLHKLLLCCFL